MRASFSGTGEYTKKFVEVMATNDDTIASVSKRRRVESAGDTLVDTHCCRLQRVISGGQTGADLGALEAAKEVGVETGGWTVPILTPLHNDKAYGLTLINQTGGGGRRTVAEGLIERSKRNVDMADGTIIFRMCSSIGTDKTIAYCAKGRWPVGPPPPLLTIPDKLTTCVERRQYRRHMIVTDMPQDREEEVADAIVDFLRVNHVRILNVAGHRDDATAGMPNFQGRVRRVLVLAFRKLEEGGCLETPKTPATKKE